MGDEKDPYWFEVYAFAYEKNHGDAPFFVFRSLSQNEAIGFMRHLPIHTHSHILKIRQSHIDTIEYIPFAKVASKKK